MSSSYRQLPRFSSSVLLLAVIGIAINLLIASPLNAHDEFKEVLERRYRLKSVSCKACHTSNKSKKIRNAFGKLLDEELKEQNLTKRYHDAKEEGEEAEEKFEKTMVKEFTVALKAVEKKPVAFQALLEAGLLNGTRLDKNQVDEDALTVKTLSDAEVDAIEIKKSSMIKGEIKKMPAVEKKPTAADSEMDQEKSKPVSNPDPSDAQPESDDNTPDKPKTTAASDDAKKSE